MSKGNPIVSCRLTREMHEQIQEIVERSVLSAKGEPHTVASWIVQCVRQELGRIRRNDEYRARKRGRRQAPATGPEITVADPGANV